MAASANALVERTLAFLQSHVALSGLLDGYEQRHELPDENQITEHLEMLRKHRVGTTTFLIQYGHYAPENAECIVAQLCAAWERCAATPWGCLDLAETRGIIQQFAARFATALNLYEEGLRMRAPTRSVSPHPTEDHPPHPDGPELPDKFWWKGESRDLEPIPCRLLTVIWKQEKIKVDNAIEQVWGHHAESKETALKSALNKINNCLSSARVPYSYSQKQGWIVKNE
jgi:hypothetical protein